MTQPLQEQPNRSIVKSLGAGTVQDDDGKRWDGDLFATKLGIEVRNSQYWGGYEEIEYRRIAWVELTQ